MKILVIRGYKSENFFEHTLDLNGTKAHLTIEPIGEPVLVKKKLLSILAKYNLDEFDHIYTVSMSSCMTSLIDAKYFDKLCMVTPFYLYNRPVFKLLKSRSKFKDFLGCQLLMLLNGRMGSFDDRIRLILAEKDNVTDNRFFKKKFSNLKELSDLDHYLGEEGALKVIEDDLLSRI